MGPISTGLGEIYQFEVRGDSPRPWSAGRSWNGETRCGLRMVLACDEVDAPGGELKTYEIQVVPEHLLAHNVSLGELFRAVEANNANAGGAYIEHGAIGCSYPGRRAGHHAPGSGRHRDLDADGTPVYVARWRTSGSRRWCARGR
ncbi:MAG: hypothetical protein R2909_22445 [Gemmatimonadales bacterium]